MKNKNIFIIILFASLFLGISVHAAGVPALISYQGRLTNNSGSLLTGTYYFRFSIWDASANGNQLWPSGNATPSSTQATLQEGVFNMNIGSADTLNFDFNTNSDIYLQVEVSSNGSSFDPPLSPRQRIASTAFSQLAGAVSGTGQSSFGTTSSFDANTIVTIAAKATSSIPLIIKGLASQAADLFRIVSGAGATLFSFTDDGSFVFGNGFYLKQDNASTTTMYDPANAVIMQFDTGE
jgi:hypothetical protein